MRVNGPTEGLYSIIKKFKGRCRVRELRPLSNQDPCPVVIEPSETGRYAFDLFDDRVQTLGRTVRCSGRMPT